jgi:hypothetical protein
MTHRDGFPKVFGEERVAWRCGTSQAVRDVVRKPWETAVPVAWVIIGAPWYNQSHDVRYRR